MPGSASAEGNVDKVLPLDTMAEAIIAFANGRVVWQ
jgi:chemotaxis response regulator CheB